MHEEQLRCDFCGSAINPLDLLQGRAVVVFRKRYCPNCMTSAIQRGKSSGSNRYNTPNPAIRRTLPLAPPSPVPALPPAVAPARPAAPAAVRVDLPAPPAVPPELPLSLLAVLPPAKTAPKPTPSPQATRRLKVGEHGCGFYSSEEDRRYQLGPYLRDGLEGNEKVLHFLRAPSPEKVLGDFRAAGLNAPEYLQSGQLEIVPVGKLLGASGAFDPSKITERILQAADRALEDGYSRLRIAGEMTWALGSQVDFAALIEYEKTLTALAIRGKCTCLCQYNVYRFDAASLHQVRKIHPYVFAKGTAAMVMHELEPAQPAEK